MSDFEFKIEMPDVTDEALKMLYMKTMEHRVAIMKERDELKEENEKLKDRISDIIEAWQKDAGKGLRGGQRLDELQAENEKLKKENEELTDELEDLEQVREENEQLTEELEDLEEVREDRDEMYEENKKLKEEMDKVKEVLDGAPAHTQDLQPSEGVKVIIEYLRKSRNENKKLKEALESECKQHGEEQDCSYELLDENKRLKEEVIAERKKVAQAEDDRRFVGEMWMAESQFLQMPSAKQQPEEFNEFLKAEFDEEMYKKMYDEFNLAEFLECSDEEEESE